MKNLLSPSKMEIVQRKIEELGPDEYLDVTHLKEDGKGSRKLKKIPKDYVSYPYYKVAFNQTLAFDGFKNFLRLIKVSEGEINSMINDLEEEVEEEQREFLDSKWIANEDCSSFKKDDCLNSDTCFWAGDRCKLYQPYAELKFKDLPKVMKPYKYYTVSAIPLSKRIFENIEEFESRLKPSGFWFAVGDEWIQQIIKEGRNLYRPYEYLYEVEIDPKEFIIINNYRDLIEFTRKYEKAVPKKQINELLKVLKSQNPDEKTISFFTQSWNSQRFINWPKVIKDTGKSGILVSFNFMELNEKVPKEMRLEIPRWFQGFDVASGAVWNKKGIKRFNLIYEKV